VVDGGHECGITPVDASAVVDEASLDGPFVEEPLQVLIHRTSFFTHP
jgi:hypothetical protein